MTITFNPAGITTHNIAIESGTFEGDFCLMVCNDYDKIHTIEVVESFYNNAKERLKDHHNIECHFGNSPEIIRKLLEDIDEPVMFWLDAHYHGGTQSPDTMKPLLAELEAIASHHIKTHMIMIDDVREFPVYGTTKCEVESILKEINPNYIIEYRDGCTPNDILIAR